MTIADQIRAYRRTGSIQGAARELGIGYATLYRRLKAAGVDTTGRHRPVVTLSRRRVAELCALYDRGLTQQDLAYVAGVSQGAISVMLRREGVPTRPPSNPSAAELRRRRAILNEIGRPDLFARPTSPARPLRSLPQSDIDKLCDLYERGLTFADVAAIAGASKRAVGLMLAREGIAIRPGGAQTIADRRRRREVLEQLGRLDLLKEALAA